MLKRAIIWHSRWLLALATWVFFVGAVPPVHLSRYIYGDYLAGNTHRIELFNASDKAQDISGWTLITRQYVARFPEGTRIAPFRSMSMAKTGNVTLPFTRFSAFSIRLASDLNQGDYAVLYDKRGRIADAFWVSDANPPAFLPDQASLPADGEAQHFTIPAWTHKAWEAMHIDPNAAMAFVRFEGQWQITSDRRNLLPATEFGALSAEWVDGIVMLRWRTTFEQECYQFALERSSDGGRTFAEISREPAHISAAAATEYTAYDIRIERNRTYTYRISQTDKFGNILTSPHAEVVTSEASGGFSMEGFRGSRALNIRIGTQTAQALRLLLLDGQFREVETLFVGELLADTQWLLTYDSPLPAGTYYLIADTDARRYYQTLRL